MLPDIFKKEKRKREQNVINEDNDEKEDDDDFEVKQKRSVLFKVDGLQSPPFFAPESQTNSQIQGSETLEPVTWGV
jgi:hypothetical protein